MRALCLIREGLHYRREAYLDGMKRAGLKPVAALSDPGPGDFLIIWNRYGRFHETAKLFESRGARVLVTENGWLGKAWNAGEWFTLCEGHHGGAGSWPVDGPERWDSWGAELQPWRTGTETIILGQRGIGEPGMRSPNGWEAATQKRVGGRIRPHLGKSNPPLSPDLRKAQKVVTWASGAALKAILYGVPVWHDFPQWIGASAASRIGETLVTDDAKRLAMFRRLAWSMWTLDEIRSGSPFSRFMDRA